MEPWEPSPGRKPEFFTRSLSAEVSLGAQIDPQRSNLKVKWQGTAGFELTLTPQDRFGNLISPTSMVTPQVELEGHAVEVVHEDRLDGSHRLKVTIKGKGKPDSLPRPLLRVAGQQLLLPPPKRDKGV